MQAIEYASQNLFNYNEDGKIQSLNSTVITLGILPILGLDQSYRFKVTDDSTVTIKDVIPDIAEDIKNSSINELTDIGYTFSYDENTEKLTLQVPIN